MSCALVCNIPYLSERVLAKFSPHAGWYAMCITAHTKASHVVRTRMPRATSRASVGEAQPGPRAGPCCREQHRAARSSMDPEPAVLLSGQPPLAVRLGPHRSSLGGQGLALNQLGSPYTARPESESRYTTALCGCSFRLSLSRHGRDQPGAAVQYAPGPTTGTD